MRERSWTYLDRKGWGDGEWANEPDKMQWLDAETGLPCLIVRNRSGALCGYVGVAEGHPAFGVGYDSIEPYPDVHGGLTFADFCKPYGPDNEHGICHVVDEGENERVWWLGFDCAHCDDWTPAYSHRFPRDHEEYRNIAYVKGQVRFLARQLVNPPERDAEIRT